MRARIPSRLMIGTDGWNWEDWVGVFYPEGTPKSEFLREYSRHYNIVEVDSTFYRIPSKATVQRWIEETPDHFFFAVKVPRGVTHRGFQGDYQERLSFFLKVMSTLGQKLGPVLFQFPYYAQTVFPSVSVFVEAFEPLLASLPPGNQYAVEVRNKEWVAPELLDSLRKHNIAFVLVDHPWAEDIEILLERMDVITADFCYIRWLGHHTQAEKLSDKWDHLVIDRTEAARQWARVLKNLLKRDIKMIYGIFRNRYAGYAPGSIELLEKLWEETA